MVSDPIFWLARVQRALCPRGAERVFAFAHRYGFTLYKSNFTCQIRRDFQRKPARRGAMPRSAVVWTGAGKPARRA
eukprot:2916626-Prymnesium_polylepis.1